MSAVNIIVEETRALVWTDAGVHDRDGRLIALRPNCIPVKGMPAVVCADGDASLAQRLSVYLATFAADLGTTFDALIERMGRQIDIALETEGSRTDDEVDLQIWLVGWSTERARPVCLAFSSIDGWRLVDAVTCPPMLDSGATLLRNEVGYTGWPDFDKADLGIPMMEAQRIAEFSDRSTRTHIPSGHIQQTVVSAKGIAQRVLRRWPGDRIRQLIIPDRPKVFGPGPGAPLRASRSARR